jgi:hypothetical protein
MEQKFLDFLGNFDFKALVQLLSTGEWEFISFGAIVTSYIFLGVAVLIAALALYKKTKGLGKFLAVWVPVAIFYFAGGVVLKNSDITQVGPFLLGMVMAVGAFGYMIYQKMLKG